MQRDVHWGISLGSFCIDHDPAFSTVVASYAREVFLQNETDTSLFSKWPPSIPVVEC